MKNSKLALWGAINSLGAFVYILIVAWIMFNGEKIFGKMNNFLGPVALLLLFVLSATIVGALVLGRPVFLYLGGSKSDAVKLLSYTVGYLLILTIIVFLIQVII
ncbi:MAG: hypothetical protein HY764_02725 [Candidatus Portnoybacteria bacterium]|nr:hypothetical protein [Candidatus Portnoybacteria bacterium]